MTIERYEHHGRTVAVESELKGKHREHCLCYACQHFAPGQVGNCPIAQGLYEFCVAHHVVTPVYECAGFELAP